MRSSDSNQQNEVLNDANTQRIRITASHHPLCGQSFKVRRHIHRDAGEDEVVIELPDGHTQAVLVAWTDLVDISLSEAEPFPQFSADSLQALVIMVASLSHLAQPEVCHAPSDVIPVVDDVQCREPATIDPPVGRPAVSSTASPAVATARRSV